MECPECHYQNPEGAVCCGLCGLVLKREETTSGPQAAAGRSPAPGTEEPLSETYHPGARLWWGRAFKTVFFLLLGGIVFVHILNSRGGIPWDVDFERAESKAAELQKPRVVYFSAAWCGPCRSLERGAWKNETIKKLASQFICVKIDADKRRDLVNRFKVQGYPTVLLLSPQDEVLYQMLGYGSGMDAELGNKMEDALRIPMKQPDLEEPIGF